MWVENLSSTSFKFLKKTFKCVQHKRQQQSSSESFIFVCISLGNKFKFMSLIFHNYLISLNIKIKFLTEKVVIETGLNFRLNN